MSLSTSTWPSQVGLAPMPMVGIAMSRVISAASGSATVFDHHRESARLRHRACVGDDRRRVGAVAALGTKTAERIDRLRGEADMRHHRHAALDQEADGLRHA